jgi:hypothetical protein
VHECGPYFFGAAVNDQSSTVGKSGLYPETEAAGNAVLLNEWSFQHMIDALQRLVWQLDNEPLFLEPNQLRQRLEALDRLDAYLPDTPQPVFGADSIAAGLYRRARAICARLEAVNCELYEAIRCEIQRGARPDTLLRWVHSSPEIEEVVGPANGMGYDYLDELISGVFQFEEPNAGYVQRESEMVFYQPTPARHIFNLIDLTALTATDVLVDLGSGLGHVPLLVSICTRACSIGIELEATYVERAQQCAQRLNLNKVTFIHQDARAADLSIGTVFYLHTPFTGSILSRVLNLLRSEAATRRIRICTYGPCTSVVAEEPWLEAAAAPETHRIALFCSRD